VRLLRSHILKPFFPVFLGSIAFFVLAFELGDILPKLPHYAAQDASLKAVSLIALYYAPQCVSFSLPVSLLFAASFTLGNHYARNELLAVFTSGVSVRRYVLPIVVVGAVLSVFSFFFEDDVVIKANRERNELSQIVLKKPRNLNQSNVVVMGGSGRTVYQVYYYNDEEKSMQNVTVTERSEDGSFLYKFTAERATFVDGLWRFERVRLHRWNEKGDTVVEENLSSFSRPGLDEPPEAFRKSVAGIEELSVSEARAFIEQRRSAGFPWYAEAANLHKRFAFALTPLIVMLISSSVGGWFKKNVMVMSLVSSLSVSVAYYVTQMITMTYAELGYIAPFAGAWIPTFIFVGIGVALAATART